MTERPRELQAILAEVRRRWTQRTVLRAWTVGAAAAVVAVLAGWSVTALLTPDGLPLLVGVTIATAIAAGALARALWTLRRSPTDRQLARFIEEREPDLDDVVVTAVEYGARPDASGRMRDALFADAARALEARGLPRDSDRIVSTRSLRRAAATAAAATVALVAAIALFGPSLSRASGVATAYLFPARVTLEVAPGTARVRAGQPMTITARVSGAAAAIVPDLTVALDGASRRVRMTPAEDGTYQVTLDRVSTSFEYHVSAASVQSDRYLVTAVHPPRVERIDLHYEFPRGLGLEPRTDEDSGDIYGPEGTTVRLSIAADKPIASAALVLDDGTRVPLRATTALLDGTLKIEEDGSYRVALLDADGLENDGETEYFIRTLDDRPPNVRILRPASDREVTPLEEVEIEARADDDFGVASLELVFQTPAGRERAVRIAGGGDRLTAAGLHTLFLEEMGVQPGDFVSYYARARDVTRGRRSREARSDIFFLEVKPFEEEFVAAQSNAMAMGAGANQGGLEELAEAQKQIIVATWNLDARGRRAGGAVSTADLKAVSKAQADLRGRAEQASAQTLRMTDPRRRRRGNAPAPGEDPLGRAIESMGRAVSELDRQRTAGALPHEMDALNQLLRAAAENRRRQVARGQQAGGGGGQNRAQADLSSLFDQELRRRQQTNYETPNTTEAREEAASQEDPLERIRELARRQDALNRRQQELARTREQIEEEELRRQLERLTREQTELREQAERLRRQLASGQAGAQGQQGSRQLGEISEDMRNAATGMRRQQADEASQSGSRAAERLRQLEREMQGARPDERRRALGDLQMETRQLADAQRRLAGDANRATQGRAGDDAQRRLAGEQERLADRAERLEETVKRLAQAETGESDQAQATGAAARELERQQLSERMRDSAEALRKGEPRHGDQQQMAQALDRIAEQLGAASGTQDAETRRYSEQLARAQELRDRMQQIDRTIEQLRREAQQGDQGQNAAGRNGSNGNGRDRTNGQGRNRTEGTDRSEGQGVSPGQSSPAGQNASSPGAGNGNGSGGRMEQLQQQLNEDMRQAEQLSETLRRDHPGLRDTNPDAAWWRSFSAPGTEAFKQDFSRWESLKQHLLVALEDVESDLSGELRARENHQRLNAGGHDSVSEEYRRLVDEYYRSLAAPRRPR